MRHAIFAHGNFDFHTGVVDFAQHLDHTPGRLTKQGGGFGQFNHHDLAGFRRAGRTFWDQHILTVAFVLRRHQPNTAFLKQAANNGLLRAIEDFSDAPFGASSAV